MATADLLMAATEGVLLSVEAALEGGADVDAVDEGGNCALHLALQGGHVGAVRALLAAGANTTLLDGEGQAPLALAAQLESAECLAVLLAAGADAAGPAGGLALRAAVAADSVACVTALLAAGVDVHGGRVTGVLFFSHLMAACNAGKLGAARALLAAGANPLDSDELGVSALHQCQYGPHPAVLRELLAVPGPGRIPDEALPGHACAGVPLTQLRSDAAWDGAAMRPGRGAAVAFRAAWRKRYSDAASREARLAALK